MLDGNEQVKVWSVRLLNKEKGPSIGGVKFNIPPAPPSIRLPRWKRRVGVEEEEGDVKMDGGHEDGGDYEAESSAEKRGQGKRKRKGKGKVWRPEKVRVAPPPPAAVPPTTTTPQ